MSNILNVNEQDLNDFAKLAEQQKNQSAEKIINRILEPKHDVQFAETFKPITNKLTQLLKNQVLRMGIVKHHLYKL